VASWILVPCLVSLRDEFNELAPGRDKGSDGSIGDTAHAGNSSDHNPDETGNTPSEDADSTNEVHAIDVDVDLRKSGWTMAKAVEIIVTRHRTGEDDRLQNVIYNRRIWSRSWGWTAREYTGSNPHDKHAHFSSRYTTAQERDTRPWGLLEEDDDDMATISQADFNARMNGYLATDAGQKAVGKAVVEALEEQLDMDGGAKPDGTTEPVSKLAGAFRRLWLQYPFTDGTTSYNVFANLKTFLLRQLAPAEQSKQPLKK
jgi:hypothetical protein